MKHGLKTWPVPFRAMLARQKLHDVRRTTDRSFDVGDVLRYREWVPDAPADPRTDGKYTGRELYARVTYVTRGGDWGLPPDLCIMSIQVLADALRAPRPGFSGPPSEMRIDIDDEERDSGDPVERVSAPPEDPK